MWGTIGWSAILGLSVLCSAGCGSTRQSGDGAAIDAGTEVATGGEPDRTTDENPGGMPHVTGGDPGEPSAVTGGELASEPDAGAEELCIGCCVGVGCLGDLCGNGRLDFVPWLQGVRDGTAMETCDSGPGGTYPCENPDVLCSVRFLQSGQNVAYAHDPSRSEPVATTLTYETVNGNFPGARAAWGLELRPFHEAVTGKLPVVFKMEARDNPDGTWSQTVARQEVVLPAGHILSWLSGVVGGQCELTMDSFRGDDGSWTALPAKQRLESGATITGASLWATDGLEVDVAQTGDGAWVSVVPEQTVNSFSARDTEVFYGEVTAASFMASDGSWQVQPRPGSITFTRAYWGPVFVDQVSGLPGCTVVLEEFLDGAGDPVVLPATQTIELKNPEFGLDERGDCLRVQLEPYDYDYDVSGAVEPKPDGIYGIAQVHLQPTQLPNGDWQLEVDTVELGEGGLLRVEQGQTVIEGPASVRLRREGDYHVLVE